MVWENVRVVKSSGEAVSKTGTHLGHNIPDKNGNRYCINLVRPAAHTHAHGLGAPQHSQGMRWLSVGCNVATNPCRRFL